MHACMSSCSLPKHDCGDVRAVQNADDFASATADDEFQDLCFQYGVELDDVVSGAVACAVSHECTPSV